MTASRLTSPNQLMEEYITDSESIQIVQCANSIFDNLERLSISKDNSDSLSKNTSYSQDDICVLDPRDFHYSLSQGESFNEHNCTVLNANNENTPILEERNENPHPIEESIGLIVSYRQGKSTRATSTTESDVEILMSDEIVSSEGSFDNARLVSLNSPENKEELPKNKSDQDLGDQPRLSFSDCTEELNIEELSEESMEDYSMMTHSQLIKLVKEQVIKIRSLEATLKRSRQFHRALFMQVDTLRTELKEFDKQIIESPDVVELNNSFSID